MPLLARVNGAEQMLAARFDPLHRAAHAPGSEWDEQILRIELDLDAETSTNIGR